MDCKGFHCFLEFIWGGQCRGDYIWEGDFIWVGFKK